MLIYCFAERYPDPYKPYLDTQLAYLLRESHRVQVFAEGRYERDRVGLSTELLNLEEKTQYYPSTLKTLPRFFGNACIATIKSPLASLKNLYRTIDGSASFKKNLMSAARALVLPTAEPDVCLIHNLATMEKLTFLKQLYPGSKVVMYYHGGELPRQQFIRDEKNIFDSTDKVFTCTRYSLDHAVKRGCPSEKIFISPVGFELNNYPVDENKFYRKDEVLRMVSIGRFSQEKGFIFALQAIHSLVKEGHTNIHYTLIGDGYLKRELIDYVHTNGLEGYVEFAGEMPYAKVIETLSKMDLLVLPSITTERCAENQACVVQEALLMRLLVISTKVGGVQESICDELTLFSVEEQDSAGIASMIKLVLGFSQSKFRTYADRGREFAINKYSISKVTQQLLQQSIG
ncbi:MAG: glycosyltransferase family 4 protein [Gammaproteobacteria bacterium]|nr:glycosyltransferase family 4 protein [Gammaproteobacteria bacterium]MDH5799224.1 glycosyltransferase family 4 protein [Gammaproteobacteria bacterium]